MRVDPEILLVPVDGSEGSNNAVRLAASLAEKLDVPIRLLFAFPQDAFEMYGFPSQRPDPEQFKYYSPEAFSRLRDRTADSVFEKARAAMGEVSVTVEQQIVNGHAAKAILKHADGIANAMIIMGSRGLGGFGQLLLGSVSQRVLHHARCPVTIVRP